jgi:hypothetical protein
MPSRVSAPLVLALALGGIHAPAQARAPNAVMTVGKSIGCGFTDVQQAVDAAKLQAGADVIVIESEHAYLAQQIRIDDVAPLSLVGGYRSCTDVSGGPNTVLSGAGGAAAPVITHLGPAPLELHGLTLTAGDTDDAGGGLDSRGDGDLLLHDVEFRANQAVFGGGVYAFGGSGEAGVKRIVLSGTIAFVENIAEIGGGLFLVNGRIDLEGTPLLRVSRNRAILGDGGGWHLLNSSMESADPGAMLGCPSGFAQNQAAGRGGAVFLSAHGGVARLRTRVAAGCMVDFVSNVAGVSGGAIHIGADADPVSPVPPEAGVTLFDARLLRNRAPDGAAALVRTGPPAGMIPAPLAYLVLAPGDRPTGTRSGCDFPPVSACASMNENRSEQLDGTPTGGATLAGLAAPGAPVYLDLDESSFLGNRGGDVIRVSGAQADLQVRDSLFARGSLQRVLSADDDAFVQIERSTFSGSGFTSTPGAAILLGDRRLRLYGSIVDFQGRDFLRMRRAANEADVRDVLVRQQALPFNADHPPAAVQGLLRTLEFGFADLESGDYRLLRGSPAIDRYRPAHLDEERVADLDARLRGYDDAGAPNAPGAVYDLGAYEQADGVFRDGLE